MKISKDKHLFLLVCLCLLEALNVILSHAFPLPLNNRETNEVKNTINDSGKGPGASALLPFLKKFGYLESGNSSNHESDTLYTQDSVEAAVKEMQKFGALPQTGKLDTATLALLSKPRCGLPDVIRDNAYTSTRKKRYVIGAKGWNKRRITYRIENWSPGLDESSVSSEVKKAFNAWADYARLRFIDKPRWNYDDVDISISFGRGHHGDGYPFDGAGGVLAHAFFPYGHGSLGGDIHFDLDEPWRSSYSDSSSNGGNNAESSISFFAVSIHEIGHSLGLSHSPSQDSVMFPYYQYYEQGAGEKVRLGYDDIMAMYQLYIQRSIEDFPDVETSSTHRPTTEMMPTTTKRFTHPEYTRSTTISTTRYNYPEYTTPTTISTTRNNYPATESTTNGYSYATESSSSTYHFGMDGQTSMRPTRPTAPTVVTSVYPTSTSRYPTKPVPELCKDGYDTITYIRNEIFVFKDEYMWRFSKMGMKEPGYPVKTARLFRMLKDVPRIDAAFENEDGKIYFFSGKKYWIYHENGRGSEQSSPITDFELPHQLHKIDAAFIWGKNKKIYLFSGNLFWRLNGTTKSMDDGYPKGIERWRGLPQNGIDSALKWSDGRTYFFKKDEFWRFDDTIVETDEGFPLPTSAFWFGC